MECLAESADYGHRVCADMHFGLELRRAAGHPAGGAEQGELLQADALAHGGCHAVRYRVLQNK